VLSYGAWVTFGSQVGVEAAKKLMQQARDAGVNLCVLLFLFFP
jgi:aryl-alcohol dehydrogenase-like predicted oxidoreductase